MELTELEKQIIDVVTNYPEFRVEFITKKGKGCSATEMRVSYKEIDIVNEEMGECSGKTLYELKRIQEEGIAFILHNLIKPITHHCWYMTENNTVLCSEGSVEVTIRKDGVYVYMFDLDYALTLLDDEELIEQLDNENCNEDLDSEFVNKILDEMNKRTTFRSEV